MSEDIFRHADRSLMVIFNQVAREFQNMGTTLGFDELNAANAMKMVEVAYQRLDVVAQREYRRIARRAYEDACKEAGYTPSRFDTTRFVSDMLRAYDPLTEYVYVHEWERKRDRLFESIMAVEGSSNQDMRVALKRAMDLLANQIRQYADNVTAQARIRAFKDAGADVLVWITEKDERVCPVCKARDEQFYPIETLPFYPAHWRCRCKLQIADMEEEPPRKSIS